MSVIRDFVVGLPAACGVPAGLSDIYGKLNGELYDWELANPEGALNRRNFDSLFSRLDLGFVAWGDLVEDNHWATIRFARNLLTYAVRTIDANGGDWLRKEAARKELVADAAKPENANVLALMAIDTAGTMSNWA